MTPAIESIFLKPHRRRHRRRRFVGRRFAVTVVFAVAAAVMPSVGAADSWSIDLPCPKGTYQPPKCGATEVLEEPTCSQDSECPGDGYACRRVWYDDASKYQHRCVRPRPPRFEDYVANPGQVDVKPSPLAFDGELRDLHLVSVGGSKSIYEGERFMFAAFSCETGRRAVAELRPRMDDPRIGDRMHVVVIAPDGDGRPVTLAAAEAAGNGQSVRLPFVCGRSGVHLVGASQIGGGTGQMASLKVRLEDDPSGK